MKVVHHLPHSFQNIEVELTDWRGTPIDVGSRVVYGVHLDMIEGEVADININGTKPGSYGYDYVDHRKRKIDNLDRILTQEGFDEEKHQEMLYLMRTCYKVKIRRLAVSGGFASWQQKGTIANLKETERVTVIT